MKLLVSFIYKKMLFIVVGKRGKIEKKGKLTDALPAGWTTADRARSNLAVAGGHAAHGPRRVAHRADALAPCRRCTGAPCARVSGPPLSKCVRAAVCTCIRPRLSIF
jgi:hypothetical protein